MKKFKFLLVAFALVLALGAQAFQKTVPMYYFDQSQNKIVLIEGDGFCDDTELEVYCKYTLNEGAADDGDPAHYTPASSPVGKIWVPDTK